MAKKEALITIYKDGTPHPMKKHLEPATYSTNTATLIDTGTSVSGKMLGAVVRESVTTISLSWRFLYAEDWAFINGLFKSDEKTGKRFSNEVDYFDQTIGDWVESREMYVSDRSAGLWRRDENGNVVGWLECSLDLTEV